MRDESMINDLHRENVARVTRRQLFGSAASGVGLAALASLLATGTARGAGADRPKRRSRVCRACRIFAPKAKRVVVLWQGGGPSHVDLFDPKPAMAGDGRQGHPRERPRHDAALDHVERLRQVARRCPRSSRSRSTASAASS